MLKSAVILTLFFLLTACGKQNPAESPTPAGNAGSTQQPLSEGATEILNLSIREAPIELTWEYKAENDADFEILACNDQGVCQGYVILECIGRTLCEVTDSRTLNPRVNMEFRRSASDGISRFSFNEFAFDHVSEITSIENAKFVVRVTRILGTVN